MAHTFDDGYAAQPFRGLVADYPGASAYPSADFRLEWGPVFHRGRLDGSARVLVLGQDPAEHETIARRILVGEAGHRVQGLLAKLGVDRSYVMVNTFLYSVYGQGRGGRHVLDTRIKRYRERWLDAVFSTAEIDAVVALGSLADRAWGDWAARPQGVAYRRVTHPTQPESAGGDRRKHAAAIAALLANWNEALQALHPLPHRDKQRPLRLYGDAFAPGERPPIPEEDLPAGTPEWMRTSDGWADRTGTGVAKRRTITVTVPRDALP